MKRFQKLIVVALIAGLMTLCTVVGLTGCGAESKAKNTYICTVAGGIDLPDYEMHQPGFNNYVVTTYSDNTYEMTLVIYIDMYGTPGSVVINTTGKYTTGENADGDTVITLSDAESILYTTCGMFTMQYSWNTDLPDTAFPVELLGSTSAHNTLEDLQNRFGKGFSFKVIANEKEGQQDCLFEIIEG